MIILTYDDGTQFTLTRDAARTLARAYPWDGHIYSNDVQHWTYFDDGAFCLVSCDKDALSTVAKGI